MLPGMAMGVVLGYVFATSVDETVVTAFIGLLSLLFGLYRLWLERGGKIPLPSNSPRWVGLLFGVGSGFASQIAHAGAPPFQMWVIPRQLPGGAPHPRAQGLGNSPTRRRAGKGCPTR